ncbi:MAG: hypothetical protein JWM43_1106 [Acidobacteriaceae bacterium]|nr:hypothetical protein [Acidobacteriaceae bacterium]
MTSNVRNFQPINFKTRFPALDGIRALAVTMVFFAHYGGGAHGGIVLQLLNQLRSRGWTGVDLFFALSGFLITGILFDTRSDSHYFKRFFARRSMRIFPVFYLVCAVLLLLTPVFHYQWHWLQLTFLVYFGNFFGNYNFDLYNIVSPTVRSASVSIAHFWSLCVEEQFYLLWPIAVWLVRDRIRLIWIASIFSGIALLLRIWWCIVHPISPETWIVRTLPFRMDALLLGGILALVLRGPNSDRWQRSCKWIFLGSLAILVPILLRQQGPGLDSPLVLTLGFTLIAFASVGLIGVTLRSGSPVFRLFHLWPLRVIGKYSYGFYIFHMLYQWVWIQFLVFAYNKTHSRAISGVLELAGAYIFTFLLAKLSYDLFEVRFLRWKVNFEYDSEVTEHKHAFITN